jgi:hypothetical protein
LLIVPNTLALSSHAVDAIKEFLAAGGRAAIIGQAGIFDGHGRQRMQAPFASVSLPQPTLLAQFSLKDVQAISNGVAHLASDAGLEPVARIRAGDESMIHLYVKRLNGRTILALQSDAGSDGAAVNRETVLHLNHAANIFDLGNHRALGRLSEVHVHVSSGVPTVLAFNNDDRQ